MWCYVEYILFFCCQIIRFSSGFCLLNTLKYSFILSYCLYHTFPFSLSNFFLRPLTWVYYETEIPCVLPTVTELQSPESSQSSEDFLDSGFSKHTSNQSDIPISRGLKASQSLPDLSKYSKELSKFRNYGQQEVRGHNFTLYTAEDSTNPSISSNSPNSMNPPLNTTSSFFPTHLSPTFMIPREFTKQDIIDAFLSIKGVDRWLVREKHQYLLEYLKTIKQKTTDHFTLRSFIRLLGEFNSFNSADRIVHNYFGSFGNVENPALQLTPNMSFPRPPCVRTIRQKLFLDVEKYIKIIQRPMKVKTWPMQGQGFKFDIVSLLFDFLQTLYKFDLIIPRTKRQYQASQTMIIYLSTGSDGAKLGNVPSSRFYLVVFSLLLHEDLFYHDCEHLVTRPIPSVLLCDSETLDTINWLGELVSEDIKTLSNLTWFYFSNQKGFFKKGPEQPTNNNDMIFRVEFRVIASVGDGKSQQYWGGSNTGSSLFRCFMCFEPRDNWLDFSILLPPCYPTRTISSTIS